MKIRIRVDAILDPPDTASIDQLRNGVVALQGKMKRINAFETSTITVEKCRHDEAGTCEVIYRWTKA